MRRALAALVLAVALPLPGLADLVVQPGETLSEIAERNGVGLQQLMRANGIENPKLVQAGQRLVLPGGATAPSGRSRGSRANGGPNGGAKTGTVVVQPGETLSEIAERNGVGLQQLMRANGIENPKLVQAGQRLVLPGGAATTANRSRGSGRANGGPTGGAKTGTVLVQPGETLSEIAERNGVGLQQLMRTNGIENPKLVQAGQRLLLPGGATTAASGGGNGRGRDGGAAAPGASGRSFSYSVKEGETLSEIAERYDTTVNQLMQRNRIGDPSQLQAGSQLLIPGTQVAAPSSNTSRSATAKPAGQAFNPKAKEHVVQSGESLSQIADGYKVPMDKLVVINNISNPDLVLSGTRLKLTAPPPVTPAKPSNPVKPTGSASQIAVKPAPAKPAAPKASAKATTAASAGQSFPAAPTSKPRVTPNPGTTSPAFGQGQTSRPTSSPVVINTTGSAISGKPTTGKSITAKASPVPITAAGQSAATTATATANTTTTANTTAAATGTATGTGTGTGTAPAKKAAIASTAAAATAASMASSGAGSGNSANPKPEKSSPITAKPAAKTSPTASGSAQNSSTSNSSTLNSAAPNSAPINSSTPNNSAANTVAANTSARGVAGRVGGQPAAAATAAAAAAAAAATSAKIATTDSGAAPAASGAVSSAVSSRALGGSKPLDSAKTAKNIAPEWRTYGPISVDWANWQSMGGSYVAPSLNGEGQPLYTAINCGARKLNSTSQSGQWKTWEGPRSDAEQQLVNDLCKAKGG
jgi:LysM repeat protein